MKSYMLLLSPLLLLYRLRQIYNHKLHLLIKMDNPLSVCRRSISTFLHPRKYTKYKHYKMELKYKQPKTHSMKTVHRKTSYGFIRECGE